MLVALQHSFCHCHTLEDTVAIRKVGKHNKFIFIICIYALKQCSTVFSTTCHILRTDAHMPQGSEIISVRIKLKNTKGLDSRSGSSETNVTSLLEAETERFTRVEPEGVRLLYGSSCWQEDKDSNTNTAGIIIANRFNFNIGFILHILYFIIIL